MIEGKLNDYMNKYNVGQYKGGDFIRMATNLRDTTRSWNRLPNSIKDQFMKLMLEGNNDMSKYLKHKLIESKKEKTIEPFSNTSQVYNNNNNNIFTIIVISIVAITIGFLIACCCSY